jgi:hypothetical protein
MTLAQVTTRKLIIVLATAAALMLGVLAILHVPGVTGPWFWRWLYRRLPPWPLYGALAAAAVPFFVGQVVHHRLRRRDATALALACVALACLGMKLASVLPHTDPPSLALIEIIVENPDATSYYTDAAALRSAHAGGAREWLPLYPQYMPALSLHSKTKAPGPILYWTGVIGTFGVGRTAAMAGGIGLGLLAVLSIPATYLLIRALTGLPDAAFAGASFMALCPGFVLFFPMFDATYPILTCALVGLWAGALERRDRRLAALLGVVLAFTCLVTFNVLVIGTFMALYPLVVPVQLPPRARFLRALEMGAIAVVTWLFLLLLMMPAIGYDAFATFASAWRNQHELLRRFGESRPYPLTIPFDLTDFAFGAAWSGAVIAAGFFFDRAARADVRVMRLAILCVAQLVLVAATGLLQLETARVWTFMLPLLMVPVGLEMRAWGLRARLCAYLATWFAMAAIAQNVKFIY